MKSKNDSIVLEDFELKIVREQSAKFNLTFDESKRQYTNQELSDLKIVRESFSLQELRDRGFNSNGVITSFDNISKLAENELSVGTPFANGIKKWQLPIDVLGIRILTTVFPPSTVVLPHTHSKLDQEVKSGGLRIVVKGSITFMDKKYLPGDWFFVPNGTPYTFTTDPDMETMENYAYSHTSRDGLSRISSPKAD